MNCRTEAMDSKGRGRERGTRKENVKARERECRFFAILSSNVVSWGFRVTEARTAEQRDAFPYLSLADTR
jgi:hypothetical protein